MCPVRCAVSWYEPAASAPAENTAMPTKLWVPCRWPPDSRSTSQAKAWVRKPNSREIVLSGWSMSGSVPAPAVSSTPAARCEPVTCNDGPSAANASAPLSA